MKKTLLVLAIILVALVVGCTDEAKQDLVNELKDKVEDIEKEEYDKHTSDMAKDIEKTEEIKKEEVKEEKKDETEEMIKSNDKEDDSVEQKVEEKAQEEIIEAEKTGSSDLAADDTTDDCNLLTVEDIKSVCGVETTKEVREANEGIGQACQNVFMTDDPMKGFKITYSGGYNPEPSVIKTLVDGCVDTGGEKIDGYTCFSEMAAKTTVVHGKKWKVMLANYMPMEDYFICSRDQLKELGKLVSDRIYG
jgi:hypothetical protein